MAQGIIIFADLPQPGSAAEKALVSTSEAAVSVAARGAFLAYANASASPALRKLLGGPPPRFFPQATRNTLGERMAQAFAFLFVQDFERVLLVRPGTGAPAAAELTALLNSLDKQPVAISVTATLLMVALRRADFPTVAPIFEEVAWERPDAAEAAQRVLEQGAKK